MAKTVGIGIQEFSKIIERNCVFVVKASFIKEWWESGDDVTLITRPRRFGKTLNMSMLEHFFSIEYADRGDLFEGLSIWKEEKYRELQGTYPVIFLSFAAVKATNFSDAKEQIKILLKKLYEENRFLLETGQLSGGEQKQFYAITKEPSDAQLMDAINQLCLYLHRYYDKKVIVLLDEYDTPMQEAYLGGYSREGNEPSDCLQAFGDCPRAHGWNNHERNEFTKFIRSMFNATFKTNPYLERSIMTGITRVSKESIFSDLNNLEVVTTTSTKYETSFGFTEQEVFQALDELGLIDEKKRVKEWYDGFTFGKCSDIYNPWSITNFLDKKEYKTYWASSSSNGLVNSLIRTASSKLKHNMELLLKGETITVTLDEQIVFNQLDEDEDAIWSLLLASGYLKVDHLQTEDSDGEILDEPLYTLKLTNMEVRNMFIRMMKGWFKKTGSDYNDFFNAMLTDYVKAMNAYMNDVALATFSSFDTGNRPSMRSQSERFYHGVVLGLLVELRGDYEVISNSESGFGRYDVMICPLKPDLPAFVLEFKVHDDTEENTLQDTVTAAHQQIEEMQYDTRLLERGIKKEQIRHYGFAFEGKKVLIG